MFGVTKFREASLCEAKCAFCKALGEEHPGVATTLNGMASVYRSQGRYEEALEHYERALAVRRKALGEEHHYVGDTLYNIAEVYDNQGRYSEAASSYDAAADTYAKAYGEDHDETLDATRRADSM